MAEPQVVLFVVPDDTTMASLCADLGAAESELRLLNPGLDPLRVPAGAEVRVPAEALAVEMLARLDFGDALKLLKLGKRVTRRGWNGKGMWLFLAKPIAFGLVGDCPPPAGTTSEPAIAMKTAKDTIVVGWLASQTDMLAEDWEVLA